MLAYMPARACFGAPLVVADAPVASSYPASALDQE
jgi:hypothetical protein